MKAWGQCDAIMKCLMKYSTGNILMKSKRKRKKSRWSVSPQRNSWHKFSMRCIVFIKEGKGIKSVANWADGQGGRGRRGGRKNGTEKRVRERGGGWRGEIRRRVSHRRKQWDPLPRHAELNGCNKLQTQAMKTLKTQYGRLRPSLKVYFLNQYKIFIPIIIKKKLEPEVVKVNTGPHLI